MRLSTRVLRDQVPAKVHLSPLLSLRPSRLLLSLHHRVFQAPSLLRLLQRRLRHHALTKCSKNKRKQTSSTQFQKMRSLMRSSLPVCPFAQQHPQRVIARTEDSSLHSSYQEISKTTCITKMAIKTLVTHEVDSGVCGCDSSDWIERSRQGQLHIYSLRLRDEGSSTSQYSHFFSSSFFSSSFFFFISSKS